MSVREARRLAVVVCGNGLGHYRRATAVVAALLRHRPAGLKVDLHAESWQLEAAGVPDLRSLRLHPAATAGGPRWSAATWTAGAYHEWVERLAGEESIRQADLVLSDNLAGVLHVRPDAVLMGSFLWHDVLRGAGLADDAVLDAEAALLARHRPPMLCVEEMAMPAVARTTRAVGLPWFCDPAPSARTRSWPPRRVLLMGGATGSADDALLGIAGVLAEERGVEVTAPSRLAGVAAGRLAPFDFSDAGFASCDLVVGRPGMGTLTDCVRHGLPILALGDEPNAELRHNAERVQELGLGARVSGGDPEAAARVLDGIDGDRYAAWRRSLAARPTGGTERAAEFLTRRLDLVHA